MGSTVRGDGQLFFMYAGGSMETYWKVSEVAAAIQVSEQTIYRYVANGNIPCHKLSRAVRFKSSEIESWMENRKAANHNRNIGVEVE
jgi:excisionase family DNA binding protein